MRKITEEGLGKREREKERRGEKRRQSCQQNVHYGAFPAQVMEDELARETKKPDG